MIPMILEWITYLLLAVVVYNLIVYLNHVYDLKDYPPGPFPLPLIGNLHCIDFKRPHKTYQKLTKAYGDVFSISFGMERIVMVNTIEQAKEALVTKSAEFAGRPSNHHAFAMITRNYQDLVFADYGSHWLLVRKLAIRSLKMYANLDGKLEVKVAQEVEQMNGRLMEKTNEPVNLNVEIRLFMTNIISTIVLGERYENIENPTFQKILELNNYLHYAVYHGDPISISKWQKYLPIHSTRMLSSYLAKRDEHFRNVFNKHKTNLKPEMLKNMLDLFIHTSSDEEFLQKNGISELTRDTIEMVMMDLLDASVDNTAVSLSWIILYLLHHPKYMREAYNEIKHMVGAKKYPKMSDQSSLPLVQAIIQETLRLAIGPLSLPHKSTKDSSLNGKSIKKGTQVLFHIWNIHRDERYWNDPEIFKPERWIDENGNFAPNICKSYLPFLMGKRVCFGEQIARTELFIALTRLLVDFHIEPESGLLPSLTDVTIGVNQYMTPLYKVILTKRKV